MSAKRTERLLSLVMALMSSHRGFSKQELFDEIELYRGVSSEQAREKLFDRDKAALREQGIPVETLPGDVLFDNESASQRYRINVADYSLPELTFSASELAVLSLAARMWEQASLGSAAQRALRKVSVRSGDVDAVKLPLVQPRLSTSDPHFDELWRATSERRRVRFTYDPAHSDVAQVRTIQPWGMGSRFGHWYLVGFDEARQAERYFRLSRIKGAINVLSGDYRVPEDFSIHRSLAQLDTVFEPRTATLQVLRGAGHAIRLEGEVVNGEGATDTVLLSFTDLAGMAARLAGMGATVSVVGPPDLREAVGGRLTRALDRVREPVPDYTVAEASSGMSGSSTSSSEEHLGRLLDLIPYVLHRPGADVAGTAQHFGVSTGQLVKDLNLLFVSGPRHYPEHLLDVSYEDNRIFIDNAEKFTEPVRLAKDEAYALIVGLQSLKSLPGVHEMDAVESALHTLSTAVGGTGYAEGVLGSTIAEQGVQSRLDELRGALEGRTQVQLKYLVPGRDEITQRLVDPLSIFSRDNDWYLRAWCTSADGLRNFRLDRIVEAVVTNYPSRDHPTAEQDPSTRALFTPREEDVDVTLILAEPVAWIADRYQASHRAELPDGRTVAVIPVADPSWIPGFVASHGGDVTVAAPDALRRRVEEWIMGSLGAASS